MTHPTRQALEAFHSGALPGAESGDIAEHLRSCPDCRVALEETWVPTVTSPLRHAASEPTTRLPPPPAPTRYEAEPDGAGQPRLLGRGGNGEVLAVTDRVLGRSIALKRLRSDVPIAADAGFLDEAHTTGLLEHPGIVPVYDVGLDDRGRAFYTMRRIRGRSLAEALRGATTLEQRLRHVPAFLLACHAVGFAHARGVLHRDLKPHNLMLGEHGVAYVVDWGLAQAVEPASESSAASPPVVEGTPAYMSPEQARALPVGPTTDVWGLGAVLFELLTGRPPWTGESVEAVLAAARQGERSAVAALAPGAPKDLAAICEKALAAAPADRYPSAAELARDVEAWLEGRTVSAREYSRAELARRFVRENRVPLGVAAVALVVLAAVVTFDELRVRRERASAEHFARTLLVELAQEQPLAISVPVVRKLTDLAFGHYGATTDPAALDDEALRVLADGWRGLAGMNWNAGRLDVAEQAATAADRLAREGLRRHPDDAETASVRLGAASLLAAVRDARGDDEGELALLREADVFARAFGARAPVSGARFQTEVAHLEVDLARALWASGGDEAERRLAAAVAQLDALPALDVSSALVRITALTDLAVRAWGRGDLDAARPLAERAAIAARASNLDARTYGFDEVGFALMQHGLLLRWAGDANAEAALDEAQQVLDAVVAVDPEGVSVLTTRGVLALGRGRAEQAFALFGRLTRASHAEAAGPHLRLSAALTGHCEVLESNLEKATAPMAHLAAGLCAVEGGRPAEAAAALRAAVSEHLWHELDWGRGLLDGALQRSPTATRDALTRFARDFDAGYRLGSSAQLNDALRAFAGELDGQAP